MSKECPECQEEYDYYNQEEPVWDCPTGEEVKGETNEKDKTKK